MTRKLPLEGVDNFRDYGHYPAGSGRLRRGKLFRSAHHARATDKDLEMIRALGVAVIVDLRRSDERERDRSRRWPGFEGLVIENDIPQLPSDPWDSFMQTPNLTRADVVEHMTDYYRDAPFVERHIDLYSRYFQALKETDGAVLIHCAAGKDRTGILAALTHHVAGVPDAHILDDYLLSNDQDRFERHAPSMGAAIQARTGQRPADDVLHTAMGVEPEYLATAFDAMKARYGSIDAYLETGLGVDALSREQIRAQLVE